MSKGIFTAVSGAIAQSARLDTIANNLANVNTPGFKRDGQVFKEYLTAAEKMSTVITAPRIAGTVESFYDQNGGDKSYVDIAGTYTDHSQGGLKQTGNTLDCALEGNGFYEVQTPQGVRLTRNGDFNVDAEGTLVTKQGFPVLSAGTPGQAPESRHIKLTSAKVSISPFGEIYEGQQSVAKLSMLAVGNKDALAKVGQNLYDYREGLDAKVSVAKDAQVHQGWIEQSNVNPVREMTDMIAATRTFETTQKAIKAYDEMAGKAANDISRLQKS